ncbi:MAG: hypothetical protein O2866_04840 [archaeon]|nr:hypothetical protein [archaeon]MDA1168191.1 hypothetical protein [archaeon]
MTGPASQVTGSSTDLRWSIMASLLGTNLAIMLFHGLEQEHNPTDIREFALIIIVASMPFQAVYFMVQAFVLESKETLNDSNYSLLMKLSALCQAISYFSIVGLAIIWYNMSGVIGAVFALSALAAIVLVRLAFSQVNLST